MINDEGDDIINSLKNRNILIHLKIDMKII